MIDVNGQLLAQWQNPSQILGLLLIIGGDNVQKALAQMTGPGFVPVVFSFGWLAYSLNALVAIVGENKLMPHDPDFPLNVINASNGYTRQNKSWILGRLLRDFDHWKDRDVDVIESNVLHHEKRWTSIERPARIALSVTTYRARASTGKVKLAKDTVYFSGLAIAILQLIVAAIPWIMPSQRDWSMFFMTLCGNIFAFATAALPQWYQEKIDMCRKESNKTVALTQGNGSKTVLVIKGAGFGFDLEDLAAAQGKTLPHTQTALSILSILWVIYLITISGITTNQWYLFAIGGLGTIQNLYSAGVPRSPDTSGIDLEYEGTIAGCKVMEVLMQVEQRDPGVGESLITTFFPSGDLRDEEQQYWRKARADRARLMGKDVLDDVENIQR